MTPMMRQYTAIKAKYPNAILMFRLGDFYEMFNEDAKIASEILEITLTSREIGQGARMPMCGVPHHAAQSYIGRLVEAGHKVAICEQMEPSGKGRKIVRREVVQVVTPGTILEPEFLDEKRNNYLVAVTAQKQTIGLAILDVSTGEFAVTEACGECAKDMILAEINSIRASECVITRNIEEYPLIFQDLNLQEGLVLTYLDEEPKPSASKPSIESFKNPGCTEYPLGMQAAEILLLYAAKTQMTSLDYITGIRCYSLDDALAIDWETRLSLELQDTIRTGTRGKGRTLLSIIDKTVTSMGGRLLKKWLDRPSRDLSEIKTRLDIVEELTNNVVIQSDIRKVLSCVRDLERLAARIGTGRANARDLMALAESLDAMPKLSEVVNKSGSNALKKIVLDLPDLSRLRELIFKAITDDPPHVLTEGGIIREGYSPELDKIRGKATKSREFLASLEASEREKTGIKSLKVGYNQVFGYYLEVTRANLHLVPEDWTRKQTLSGSERYIIPELKVHEGIILKAKDQGMALEYELFAKIREKVADEIPEIQQIAKAVAKIDVFSSFAEAASMYGYVRPKLHDGAELLITGARHPVVEVSLPPGAFISNDIRLDPKLCQIMVLTGPNMSGKSTLGKSVLMITLMAHMGSFVPANSALIPLTDRIAVRAGSSEEIAGGKSTFMTELLQTSRILSQSTDKTLLFIDELGRGTSTYDGMAIAQSVIEYIHNKIGAKMIFTTHFHELAALEDKLEYVRNFRIEAKEHGNEIIFLYSLQPGGCDKSYGINVARMAGMPKDVIRRASIILKDLEKRSPSRPQQMSLLAVLMDEEKTSSSSKNRDIVEELRKMDINSMTPLEALTRLAELKSGIEGGGIRDCK
jgi:DNA mismatch repair protein MutS